MGHGVAERWRVTMVVMVVVTALVFLSGLASASHDNICPTTSEVKLNTYETAYFTTSSHHYVRLRVKAAGCINDYRTWPLAGLKVSNATSKVKRFQWYEFSFINCGNYLMKIGSEVVKFKPNSEECIHQPIYLSGNDQVVLGKNCWHRGVSKKAVEMSKAACEELARLTPTETDDLLNEQNVNSSDLFFHPEEPFAPPTRRPFTFNEETYSKRRNYKENAIPIFIGIVAFTVSLCLRFCLCRGKRVVERVTTVTVIRSHSPNSSDAAQGQQDPPPAYVDVVNETSPDSPSIDTCAEPPPPAYADIVHEVLPPSYFEVEAQSKSSSEAASQADQETATQTSSPPPDPGSGPDDKESGASRSVLSKYRSQQKQFGFKVLEEDE